MSLTSPTAKVSVPRTLSCSSRLNNCHNVARPAVQPWDPQDPWKLSQRRRTKTCHQLLSRVPQLKQHDDDYLNSLPNRKTKHWLDNTSISMSISGDNVESIKFYKRWRRHPRLPKDISFDFWHRDHAYTIINFCKCACQMSNTKNQGEQES